MSSTQKKKRLATLEAIKPPTARRPYVWVREGQSFGDALRGSGLPDDGQNEFFKWRPSQ